MDFLLCTFLSGYIFKGDFDGIISLFIDLRLALAYRERIDTTSATISHTAHDEYPDGNDEEDRGNIPENCTEHVGLLFVADFAGEVSIFLSFFEELVQCFHRTDFHMHGWASAYLFIIVLEYFLYELRLDEHIYRIVVVSDDLAGISLIYHGLEFGVRQLLVDAGTSVTRKIKVCNGHCNEHVQPA